MIPPYDPAWANLAAEMAEEFLDSIEPVLNSFCDREVRFELWRTEFGSYISGKMAYKTSDGRYKHPGVNLVKMNIRSGLDLNDFTRVVRMIAQQWHMASFDNSKAHWTAVNNGKLPKILQIIFPDYYPEWIRKIYDPWVYTDYPNGGFLHNNPLLYPIQNKPGPLSYSHDTFMKKK